MKHSLTAIFSLAFCLLGAQALAQKTFRCGNTYSQTPCADGAAVDTRDARTSEQKQQADATTQRETKAGQELERERLAQQRADQAAGKSETVVAQKAKVKRSPFVPYLKKLPPSESPAGPGKKPAPKPKKSTANPASN